MMFSFLQPEKIFLSGHQVFFLLRSSPRCLMSSNHPAAWLSACPCPVLAAFGSAGLITLKSPRLAVIGVASFGRIGDGIDIEVIKVGTSCGLRSDKKSVRFDTHLGCESGSVCGIIAWRGACRFLKIRILLATHPAALDVGCGEFSLVGNIYMNRSNLPLLLGLYIRLLIFVGYFVG